MPSQILPISSSYLLPPKSSTEMMFKPLIYDDPSSTTLLDDDDHSVKPLLSRASSFNGAVSPFNGESTGLYQQNRRRRSNSDNCLSATASPDDANGQQQTIGQEVSHAAAETFLLTRLFLKLLSYLGALFKSDITTSSPPHVRRSIVYGDQPRNRLDLYLPKNSNGPKPVVAFVTGGAWIIGYKAWGSLLGQQLSERDIIVACIDYRNFPQGSISDMVKDASSGISFICNHIAEYGGDPNRIYLMGQSVT